MERATVKIRTQINGLLLLVIVFILITFGVAIVAERKVETEMHEMIRTEDLISSLEEMRKITVETALLHDEIAHDRWQYKLNQVQIELQRMGKARPYAKDQFRQLNEQASQARLAFLQFTPEAGKKGVSADTVAATVANLFATTEKMIEIGHDLIEHDREETREALENMQLITGGIMLGFGLLIIFVWRMVRTDILRPLHEFQQGTERIAAGEYSHRLNLAQQDEIGALARAFDGMSARVEQSRSQLQVEAENSRRAELALQESARYTKTILDNAVDGIITIDQLGAIQSANRAVTSIFGYATTDLVGQNFRMLVDLSAHEALEQCLSSQGEVAWSREVAGRRSDGRHFPLELALSQTVYRGQALFVGLLRDISERHRIEQMKSEFVSTVSHELRTPLTSIGGSLGLIVGGALGEVPAPIKAMLLIAHKNSLRLSHLIDDLLDMEKLVAGKFRFDLQVLPLMPLLEQSIEATHAYAEKFAVSFQLIERIEQVMVEVDGNRLQQVMANFLSNAAKFSPPGGQVQIRVTRHGDRVRVSIIDNGPGIPAEFQSQIFQKFSQADSSDTRQKGGTGLGLAITRELIVHMHGTVGFETQAGKGSSFHFELPAIFPAG